MKTKLKDDFSLLNKSLKPTSSSYLNKEPISIEIPRKSTFRIYGFSEIRHGTTFLYFT